MSYSGIEHKLRVFISSKCGGKYTIARKALKRLLELTGLVEVYVFETEPASSEDTQSAYLEYVDESNLCVFLVDNEDGVPPAVLSEEKRAKDKHLRLLYLFCDESKKESTPMQEQIKVSLSQKYYVVNDFSDIASKAYDSVMQDIIAIYRRKDEAFSSESHEEEPADSKAINTETHSLLVKSFSKYPHVARVLTESILPDNPFKQEPTETPLEKLLSSHLRTILSQKPFEASNIDNICNEVLKETDGEICEVLKLRYQAQKCYYLSKLDECLVVLQQAISIAIKKQNIPTWIVNDIAIDIRYIQALIDERNSTITLENPGQKYIDSSGEPVYFPYLDRQVENMQEEIGKRYYSQLSISPYSTNYGGLDQVFVPLANAFCIAEIHGSIVQTEITRDRLISIYSMLCTLYEDHDLFVEYIKHLIVNRDAKKLDTVIRTRNDSLSGQDIDGIMSCINNMFDPVHKMMSKYLLASRLGYYMNDTTYSALYEELVEYAMNWVREDKRIFNVNTYIFDFFRLNTHRAKGKDIIGFIGEVFNHSLRRFYMDCFKVLRTIDFANIEPTDQAIVKQMLIDMISNESEKLFDQYCSSAIIWFCKTSEISYEDLEAAIAEKYPNFYKNSFLLEMLAQRTQDLSEYIKLYLEEGQSRNRTQGENGAYSGYAYESLDVVYNILKNNSTTLSSELLNSIVNVALETLAAERQTISAKVSAVKLLRLLYFIDTGKDSLWAEVSMQMIENRATYSVGNEMGFFSKDTNAILSFQYDLFIILFNEPTRDRLIETLYTVVTSDSYAIIQFLEGIAEFLDDANGTFQEENIIAAFLYYSIFMSKHKERDVKHRATKCLIGLTHYSSAAHLALVHLSQIMDTGSQSEKTAILTRVGKIRTDDDLYLQQIINKGKSDTNYLVRYVAARESHE